MQLLESPLFRRIMYFKFFMVIAVWGLVPLLIPAAALPFLGLRALQPHLIWLRVWGSIVLADLFLYLYIYLRPRSRLAGYLMLFAIFDNGGLGTVLLMITLVRGLPWGVWINIPFQLFFGYWFLCFYRANRAGPAAVAPRSHSG